MVHLQPSPGRCRGRGDRATWEPPPAHEGAEGSRCRRRVPGGARPPLGCCGEMRCQRIQHARHPKSGPARRTALVRARRRTQPRRPAGGRWLRSSAPLHRRLCALANTCRSDDVPHSRSDVSQCRPKSGARRRGDVSQRRSAGRPGLTTAPPGRPRVFPVAVGGGDRPQRTDTAGRPHRPVRARFGDVYAGFRRQLVRWRGPRGSRPAGRRPPPSPGQPRVPPHRTTRRRRGRRRGGCRCGPGASAARLR